MGVLKDLREIHHLTQDQVVAVTEIPKMSVRRYEYGERFPKPEALKKLAGIYGLLPGELYSLMIGEGIPDTYPGKEILEQEIKKYKEWKRKNS